MNREVHVLVLREAGGAIPPADSPGRRLFISGPGLNQITPATGVYLAWPLESPIFRVSRMRRRVRRTMQKMEVGPPESTCRGRLQTAVCCCAQKAW